MTDHELERALRALYRADIDDRETAPPQLRAELPALVAAGALVGALGGAGIGAHVARARRKRLRRGRDSESKWTDSFATALTERAALANNEA